MPILNLTQHPATPAQRDAGVVDLEGEDLAILKKLLTFEECPDKHEIRQRAEEIALFALQPQTDAAMIGGAPYLMAPLEKCLKGLGKKPLYAFTRRMTIERPGTDGSVIKETVFVHTGFIEV
jgi:hypothetical protein